MVASARGKCNQVNQTELMMVVIKIIIAFDWCRWIEERDNNFQGVWHGFWSLNFLCEKGFDVTLVFNTFLNGGWVFKTEK